MPNESGSIRFDPDHVDTRACKLCNHLRPGARCVAPDVVNTGAAQPIALARSRIGPCGIEAKFLEFPGLHKAFSRR